MKARVSLATEGDRVAAHFGHCPAFTIVTISDGKETHREVVPNPGHRPGFLPRYLADRGVTHVIAGGMGPAAQDLFARHGITTIIGAQGPVDEVLTRFLDGTLTTGPSLCHHGDKEHPRHHCP